MSDLNKLLIKIKNDAAEKAAQIIKTAEEQAKEHKEAVLAEAQKERAAMIKYGCEEVARIETQMLEQHKLSLRDRQIEIKHGVIDEVFEAALEKLNRLPDDELLKFAVSKLSGYGRLDGYTILFPEKSGLNAEKVNAALSAKGIGAKLGDYSGDMKTDGGFMLFSGSIEHNYSFGSLVGFAKYEMINEVSDILF